MILETKLTLLQPKAGALLRKGLIDLIKNNLDKKLILITAGAGYGKTTLLTQLIAEAQLPFVFYDLDKNDSDLMVFYSYLVQATKQIDPALVKYSEELSKQGGETGKNIELLFGTLINELHNNRKEELFVILDNYHNIAEDSTVHRALDFFIDRLPEKIRVIISSRSVPPLPTMSRWRAKQDRFDVTRQDLAFTGDEIAVLLKDDYSTVLSEEDLRQVAAHTEGWITGIQLIMQSAGKDKVAVTERLQRQAEANQPLYEYFADEILSSETPEIQAFMIKCSILDVMTPAACDAVRDADDSEQVLKTLGKRHLFISCAGKAEYKYHHLFREFLQKRLKDEGAALHRKAAEYYKKNDSTNQAIEHFLEAGCYQEAGNGIAQIADVLENQAQFDLLTSWLQRIPAESYDQQPELLLVRGALLREQGLFQEAEEDFIRAARLFLQRHDICNQAAALMKRGRVMMLQDRHAEALNIYKKALSLDNARRSKSGKGLPSKTKWNLYSLIGLAYMSAGDAHKAKAYLLKAKRLGDDFVDDYHLFSSETNLALLLLDRGEVRQAFDLYRKCLDRTGIGYSLRIGFVFANAAQSALILGETGWAEKWLQYAWDLCQPYSDAGSKIVLKKRFGLLFIQRAQWSQAQQQLESALHDNDKLNWPSESCLILKETARLYRCRGDYAKAQDYLERAQQIIGRESAWKDSIYLTEKGLTDIILNRQDEAKRVFEAHLSLSEKTQTAPHMFYTCILGAAFYLSQGQRKKAAQYMMEAIRPAKVNGYDGILIRELRANPKLIGLTKGLKIEPVYLGRIITECRKYGMKPEESFFVNATADRPLLCVQLLGGFELANGDVDRKIQLKRKATQAILAFFLLHPGRDFTWEEIAAWAWPDSAAGAAHTMYNRAVWEIHSCSPVLRASLRYTDQHYTIQSGSQLQVDAAMFHENLQKAALANDDAQKTDLLEQAVAIYRGPLLPGVYYEWVDVLRNIMEEKYAAALGALAQLYFDKQEYERSALFCHNLLAIEELNEDKHRLLIASYIKLGQKSQALKQYKILVKLLKKNFGTKPSCETDKIITPIIRDTTT